MNRPIADLHCDLLLYLYGDEKRSAYDAVCRCSIPQFREGGVVAQVLPVYTETGPGSSKEGWAQADIFRRLPQVYPDSFEMIQKSDQLHVRQRNERIGIMLAFENGSGFCDEEEDLEAALVRLAEVEKKLAKVVYISMTWNSENRFGGGALSQVGLKDDGRRLLDFMHDRKIAIDFSHTSDQLAYGILEHIDTHGLNIPVIASHSNFRAVTDVARNLPDDIALEIFKRGGVIGINFVRPFVGADPKRDFVRQLEHGIKLGGHGQLCLGADFFYREPAGETFFPDFGNAGCYPKVMELWEEVTDLNKIAYCNLKKFLQTQIFG